VRARASERERIRYGNVVLIIIIIIIIMVVIIMVVIIITDAPALFQ
jgi:hypothetical protein